MDSFKSKKNSAEKTTKKKEYKIVFDKETVPSTVSEESPWVQSDNQISHQSQEDFKKKDRTPKQSKTNENYPHKQFINKSSSFDQRKQGNISEKKSSENTHRNKEFQNQNLFLENSNSPLNEALQSLNIAAKAKAYPASLSEYSNMSWSDLGIKDSIKNVLESQGFLFPSPVQAQSVAHAINGKDLLIRAKNGAGKTASFVIPILNNIDTSKNVLQAIILVPIRELALQVSKIFVSLGRSLGVKSMPIVGGSALTDDIIRLSAGTHVLIGTPGRVVDLLGKNLCTISQSPMIVLDEADKLLDAVFYGHIFEFLKFLPQKKQLLLYSATFPVSIESFVKKEMNDPLKIKVGEGQGLENVKQFYVKVDNSTKLPCLKSLLSSLKIDQCIIYCSSISNVKNLAQKITNLGISSYFIHSQMDQEERNIVYHNFSKNRCKILVSTDLTTRGLNVPEVNVVINFDIPFSSESYLHRIGRAGRFGANGCAVTLVNEEESQILKSYTDALDMPLMKISDPLFKEYCKQ